MRGLPYRWQPKDRKAGKTTYKVTPRNGKVAYDKLEQNKMSR
jgi:hypothetical protein